MKKKTTRPKAVITPKEKAIDEYIQENIKDKVIKSDPTSDIEVVIGERHITVHVGTFIMALRRETLRSQIMQFPSPDIETQVARYNFYAPMYACSTGDVPTEEEFLTWSDEDVNTWYLAVVEKNPRWFELSEDLEKKRN
jgi:hypothetical protein